MSAGERRASGALLALLRRARAAVRASAWASLAGRGFVMMLGLLVLAWVGRAATAATTAHASPTTDAGTAQAEPAFGPTAKAVTTAAPPPAAPSATAPLPSPATGPASRTHRATPEAPVYVNHASFEELRRLPGVGPKRADAILALRQRMGSFRRVEDLLRVKGIGRATLRKWRPLLRLDAPPGPAAHDAGAATPP